MTRPAIDTCLVLPVTVQAPAHFDLDGPDDLRHGGHFTVAGGASEAGADMHHVREINEVRHPVDPDPGDRLLLVPVTLQLLNFQAHERMAGLHAGRYCRDSGNGGLVSVAVAEETRDGVVTCMEFMAERDRLVWRAVLTIQGQNIHECQNRRNNRGSGDQCADKP